MTFTGNSSVVTYVAHPEDSEISTPPEIAAGMHFHAEHGTKTTPVLLPGDMEKWKDGFNWRKYLHHILHFYATEFILL